jgi:hypothetical protein
MSRRSSAGRNLSTALDDLSTLTEYKDQSNWTMTYKDQDIPFSIEEFESLVPLSPKEYRAKKETGLNEMRAAAGIDTVQIHKREKDIQQLQSAAGI